MGSAEPSHAEVGERVFRSFAPTQALGAWSWANIGATGAIIGEGADLQGLEQAPMFAQIRALRAHETKLRPTIALDSGPPTGTPIDPQQKPPETDPKLALE